MLSSNVASAGFEPTTLGLWAWCRTTMPLRPQVVKKIENMDSDLYGKVYEAWSNWVWHFNNQEEKNYGHIEEILRVIIKQRVDKFEQFSMIWKGKQNEIKAGDFVDNQIHFKIQKS